MDGEGNQWWERNKDALRKDDLVLEAISSLKFTKVLEIGCSDGWRLAEIAKTGAECWGIDPSPKAVAAGRAKPDIKLWVGTADELPFIERFDLVIFGFCLYLIDRSDLFKVAHEADRVLVDGGNLVIYDFSPRKPSRTPYKHLGGAFSYKMDYPALFTANPAYSAVGTLFAGELSVHILQKTVDAYPEC